MFCSLTLSTPQDGDILLDYSKNRINDEVFSLLIDLVSVNYSSVLNIGCQKTLV